MFCAYIGYLFLLQIACHTVVFAHIRQQTQSGGQVHCISIATYGRNFWEYWFFYSHDYPRFGKWLLAAPFGTCSWEKTAFATLYRPVWVWVMPFSLCNTPVMFQWMMNHVLRDYQDLAWAYIDDIIVFSHSWKEYLKVFKLVGLTVKADMRNRSCPILVTSKVVGGSNQIQRKYKLAKHSFSTVKYFVSVGSSFWPA